MGNMVLRRSGKAVPKSNQLAESSPISLSLVLLLFFALVDSTIAQVDTTISQQESQSVVLPCPVNSQKCGKLHSLNWFKGDARIAAMLLGDSNVTSVNKEFDERVTVEQNPYRLVIKDLKIADEDIYLCDTTFFIPEETCDNFNGYRIELRVLVPPTEVVILDAKGDRLENGRIVGPMQERQSLKATCTVRNTRPQPEVSWFRGTKRLTTYSPTHDLINGLYTSTLELDWQLSREDLAQDFECRVKSAAIQNVTLTKFSVDLQVRPTSININGVKHHTVQGSKVVLTCDIRGARPAVNLTWYNTTTIISSDENEITEIRTKSLEKSDGTFHTQSELIFNATRFENDRVFRCEAENIVLQINREKPISSALTLEVLYPPVVKVSPSDIIANTSEIVLLNCEYVANPASLTQVEWYRNDDLVNVNDTTHYKGGNSENVALVIKATNKEDIGNYSCQLSNNIGKGTSDHKINLDVQYAPTVEILMIPKGPVKESDESNVTLFCNVLDANPSVLTKVRWYANSTLLKELPDCEETREDLCHIDPSKLLLESIGRGFFYNYSCEGFNAAGWGPRSEEKELLVHYEPGPATLSHFPLVAVKKKSVTFSCSVDDPGFPESNRFRWLRGGRGPLQDIVTKDWTVEPIDLDNRSNYSCYAYNEGGKGVMATVSLEVHAPPFFIRNLPQYTGILHTSPNATLTCRIECVPRCDISWQKDGVPIERNDTRYFVKEKYMDASPATGDFESMLSVLHFNMPNWPDSKFNIEDDNANYTCVSTGNTVGGSIRSRTYFGIEYAPENTTVSEKIVYVQEGTIPGRVICKSRANPEPSYDWIFKNQTIANGNALIINTAMTRNDNGTYTCLAYNKHGNSIAKTIIEVQFKPRCEIERQEIDDQDTLICIAYGNPIEADFSWSIKTENETDESLGSGKKQNSDKSYYILQTDYAISRTYRCVANNTVGYGSFCEIEVAEQLAWWQLWEKNTLIILVAAILGLMLTVIIICCIIICICRRRRRQDKYLTEVPISCIQSGLSDQLEMSRLSGNLSTQDKCNAFLPKPSSSRFIGNAPKSPPRWPIRPGVMLHVSSNTKENLTVNRMTVKPSASGNGSDMSQLSAQLSVATNGSREISDGPILTELSAVSRENAASEVSSSANRKEATVPPTEKNASTLKMAPQEILSFKTRRGGHNKLDHIWSLLFKKSDDCTRDSQRSHVSLLRTFWRGMASNENISGLETQHRLKGIRCSGIVTYKRTKKSVHATSDAASNEESSLTEKPNNFQSSASIQLPSNLDGNTFKFILKGQRNNFSQEVENISCNVAPSVTTGSSFEPSTRPPSLPLKNFLNITGWSCSGIFTIVPNNIIDNEPINDKSSSLGEPLSEPGEYENLPFHGLQTAPNKFSTTPTNFNNNTNAVLIAQRPKTLIGNINQPSVGHYQDCQATQDPLLYQQQYFCDQDTQYDQRSQYNTMHRPPNNVHYNQCQNKTDFNPQDQHSPSNGFSESYTENYQQHQLPEKIPMPFRAGSSQELDSNSLSNIHLLNGTDHIPHLALVDINPFLAAANIRKYDKTNEDSMTRARHNKGTLKFENKFYSLKHPGGTKLINRALDKDYSEAGTASSTPAATEYRSLSKCKMHNSFGYNRHCSVGTHVQPMRLYDPPAYQNMVVEHVDDQVIESKEGEANLTTVQMHTHPGKEKIKKHHHWHHQHREKKDEGLGPDVHQVEPERISIYRSDSGISNSSYESQFSKPKKATLNTTSGPLVRKQAHKSMEPQNSVFDASHASNVSESDPQLDNNTPSNQYCTAQSISSSHCNRPQTRNWYSEKTTKNDFGQHQLNQKCVGLDSTPSERISLDTSSRSEYFKSAVPAECSTVQTLNEKIQPLAINPFLVENGNNEVYTGKKNNQKHRRQTISNPYEHIQSHPYARPGNLCDVSRKFQSNSSETLKMYNTGSKSNTSAPQTAAPEHSKVKNAANISSKKNRTAANREHYDGVPALNNLHASRLGSLADIDDFPSEVSSSALVGNPADVQYDCLVARRPMRMPLRKHHTFHFQSTQTANGMLQQLRERLQLQLHESRKVAQEEFPPAFDALELNEKHAFKPISAIPTISNSAVQSTREQKQDVSPQHDSARYLKGAEDDEDLGYSFCEEECIVEIDINPTSDNLITAPDNSSCTSKAV
ncbi:uncharacterized protein LOC120447830 isoform X1 [Drosophila santomea]|uniref:uncharacterized protein LOC120447830 isoform X1 n=1 Tax=Drosophila santomea TaxID=129105 RepID=UPI001CC9D935|nr:uncharacterized protein LOC120447830 isoform X1 [Drosophila santomea]XP_043862052.1 uncharacterized protein LOC120447830 isoform X1 [Drosophila santomea]XP_043862053.1 uncharacterized protein LOC120447830 isoform X1 [Drosophila santomea]